MDGIPMYELHTLYGPKNGGNGVEYLQWFAYYQPTNVHQDLLNINDCFLNPTEFQRTFQYEDMVWGGCIYTLNSRFAIVYKI